MGISSIKVRPFGTLPSGGEVAAWSLCGPDGLVVEILNYGGIVTKMLLPRADGPPLDVVLGFDDLDSYVSGHPYFGAITGRVAGRITGGAFQLDGRRYELSRNEPPNHLHGGIRGFDKQLWTAVPKMLEDGSPSLQLAYSSPDGEEGYPGNVDVCVTYTVTQGNVLLIESSATTDQTTPFSLTHHSYFHLDGEGSGSIASHTLQVEADSFIGMRDDLTLLDRLESVDGRADDLRSPRLLAEVLPSLIQDHGALYKVRPAQYEGELVPIARLSHPASGVVLTCSTTESHLQLYTASYLDGSLTGKSGRRYEKYGGICLECEGYANGANAPEIGDILLRPDKPQKRGTAYAFSTLN